MNLNDVSFSLIFGKNNMEFDWKNTYKISCSEEKGVKNLRNYGMKPDYVHLDIELHML